LNLYIKNRPIYVYLLLINFFIWLFSEMILGGSTKVLINIGANYGPYVKNGETWRLLTSVFLHSGISHLIFNSIALLAFGNLIETIFGKRNFLVLYLCSGISGSALSVTFNPNTVSVGASGAIFGMLGGLIIYYFFMKKVNPDYAKNNLFGLGLMLLINLFYGLSSSRIDNWAHLGGLLGGMFCSFVLIKFNLNSFSLGIFNVSRIHSNYKRIYIFLSFFIWSCIIFLLINI
jgi:rhomboid protease GluP